MNSLPLSDWDNNDPVIPFASLSQDPGENAGDTTSLATVGQLAAGIAHHFNNLLTPIHANSQLLLELNDLAPESRNLIEQNLSAARRAAGLIRQLAGLTDRQPLYFQPVDLNRAVEKAIGNVPLTELAGIEFDGQFGLELPRVLADAGSLDQVIRHLLLNAFDAMPHGGHLTLSTERISVKPEVTRPGPSQFICLTVSDTGCGIPLANMAHVCEPFFTTKETSGHCGLGLAFVYGIVRQHRGWTEVASKLGQGTTFKICLPAAPPPAPIVLADWSDPVSRATRRLTEWDSVGPLRLNEEAAEWEFYPATNAMSEAFHHGGINE